MSRNKVLFAIGLALIPIGFALHPVHAAGEVCGTVSSIDLTSNGAFYLGLKTEDVSEGFITAIVQGPHVDDQLALATSGLRDPKIMLCIDPSAGNGLTVTRVKRTS